MATNPKTTNGTCQRQSNAQKADTPSLRMSSSSTLKLSCHSNIRNPLRCALQLSIDKFQHSGMNTNFSRTTLRRSLSSELLLRPRKDVHWSKHTRHDAETQKHALDGYAAVDQYRHLDTINDASHKLVPEAGRAAGEAVSSLWSPAGASLWQEDTIGTGSAQLAGLSCCGAPHSKFTLCL